MGATSLKASDTATPPPAEHLWDRAAEAIRGCDALQNPEDSTIYAYLPLAGNPTKTAVVVFPGGGYAFLATKAEGFGVALYLNAQGIAAFVVCYRHGPRYKHPEPLLDATRSVRLVRSRAQQYGLDPQRIGVMGFSAGGHLAATLATHFGAGDPKATDPVERVSCRPDFAVLIYAPITFKEESIVNKGSRTNLTGDDPKLYTELSAELQVTKDTPPAFLVHGGSDTLVSAENPILFYSACLRAGVPAELHIFGEAGHSFLLGEGDPSVSGWPKLFLSWLAGNSENSS